ncbi:IS1/IS1595 family N-terminal zinc-binding domain-containing protein [Simonsiella muelleri]|uniref:IS1/IS1595 family N-terminal zinc-binding domain-containing protein n=1 Tax=Simonsiella muelleri TaxID=72 RepID=UPI003C6F9BB9
MKTEITLKYPRCQGLNIKKNGFNGNHKQKYRCKIYGHCFIGDHALDNKGCHSESDSMFYHIKSSNIGFWAINNPKQI